MSYYKITEKIKEIAEGGLMTTVTHGDFNSIDIKRQTLFPLLHIVPNNFVVTGSIVTYSLTLYFCDLVDYNKENIYTEPEPFRGVDNTIDVLNQMSFAAQNFIDKIKRGDSYAELFRLADQQTGTFFTNRLENLLAGVQLEINMTIPSSAHDNGIC